MKKLSKPNISILEIEIENKLRDGYLFSVAFNNHRLKLGQLLKAVYTETEATLNKQPKQFLR